MPPFRRRTVPNDRREHPQRATNSHRSGKNVVTCFITKSRFWRIEQIPAMRTVLKVTALCLALVIAGCKSGGLNSNGTGNMASSRVDWGMSLLAGGTVGPGQFPAKFTFDITLGPDCTNDFVAFNTSLTGASGTTANIVAFNELYSTQGSPGGYCDQDGPSVYWSYFTGTGQALTSVVLSGDGKKVAFVENTTGGAILRILEWKAGEGTGPGSPANVDHDISGSDWSTCPALSSCIVSIGFNGAANDTNSAPFYDYDDDVLYVGDNNGEVHKFTGVFNGTPAEVTISWPITVNSGTTLSGPVFDTVSRNLFVGDSTGILSFIQEVGSTVGGTTPCTPLPCVNSVYLRVGTFGSVDDAPVVDGTTGRVLAFNGNGLYLGSTTQPGTVLQASTGLTKPVSAWMGGNDVTACPDYGSGSTPRAPCAPIYAGAFDNAYLTSSTPTLSGHLYVCGKDNSETDSPAIYQLTFNATTGVLVTPLASTPLIDLVGNSSEACSPVTEIYNTNTSTDLIFFSVAENANTSNPNSLPAGSPCRTDGHGCLISIDVTSFEPPGVGTWPPTFVTNTVSLPGSPYVMYSRPSAASGIVIDNISSSSQASSMYFSLVPNSVIGTGYPGLP